MARLVDNLAQYLVDQGLATAEGTDLFIGILPDNTDNAIMIDQTGGVEADKYIPISNPTVQIMVRNTSYPTGMDKIQAIHDALHRKLDDLILEVGGVDVMTIMAMGEPAHIGADDNSRHLFSVNFVFKLRGV